MKKIFSLIYISIFIIGCQSNELPENQIEVDSLSIVDTIEIAPSYTVLNQKVGRNETFSDILTKYNVPVKKILQIAEVAKDTFDVRKIQQNKEYIIYLNEDSLKSISKIEYTVNPLESIIFDLQDTINVYRSRKPIKSVERQTSGVISGSLYETLQKNNISIILALKLSQVLAWQVDFYKVRQGDKFKVIYDELSVDDQIIDIGRIKAVYFKHWNQDYYGFYFQSGDVEDYFDEKGNSLRKAFLKSPLKFGRLASRFSKSRLHPILKYYRPHLGTDYAAPTGTPILSIGDGMVTERGYTKSAGNYVKIKHNGAYTTSYLHMSKFAKATSKGSRVKQGQVIGYVGSTGLATGPHVHLNFYQNGKAVDHLRVKFPSVKPIDSNLKDQYMSHMNILMNRLAVIPLGEDSVYSKTESVELTTNP
ncbi:MAG: peptidoglycan DD-metalloendopeptidase family protein [Melioribacteraceae bacterium]|nr:peptidoglycan DD-metalloendopeptidase family protein [Melioribacteraceae bacterium]